MQNNTLSPPSSLPLYSRHCSGLSHTLLNIYVPSFPSPPFSSFTFLFITANYSTLPHITSYHYLIHFKLPPLLLYYSSSNPANSLPLFHTLPSPNFILIFSLASVYTFTPAVGDAGGPRLNGSVSPFVMGGMGGKPSPVLDADDVSNTFVCSFV